MIVVFTEILILVSHEMQNLFLKFSAQLNKPIHGVLPGSIGVAII